jgi:putative transposase
MHRSLWYYKSKKDDTDITAKLQLLAERYPTRGFDDYYGKIRLDGLVWNRKRVLRIYRSMKLTLRRKHKRRLPQRIRQSLEAAENNYSYSMDFVSDALVNGRRVRILSVMDDCSRECLAAYADYSIPAWKVIMVLDQITKERGKPYRSE